MVKSTVGQFTLKSVDTVVHGTEALLAYVAPLEPIIEAETEEHEVADDDLHSEQPPSDQAPV
jgi:hypothetical protein